MGRAFGLRGWGCVVCGRVGWEEKGGEGRVWWVSADYVGWMDEEVWVGAGLGY